MGNPLRIRKRIHALRRAPDGSAFQKWESFKKIYKNEDQIEIDQRGFQKWKNMPEVERHPFVVEAKKVNSAYYAIMLKEINDTSEEDDEADSVMVGNFDWGPAVLMDLMNFLGDRTTETVLSKSFGSWESSWLPVTRDRATVALSLPLSKASLLASNIRIFTENVFFFFFFLYMVLLRNYKLIWKGHFCL
ncbi:uncharacterized protein LOC131223917 isoform X2 [Magnolia sinica]|uniref:uncharacterized protein LOC131223917 isoform X2 n=1 Tax=Magnolia sinica TaxID=86752 RepID=UPI00265AB53F|nr:uncharacterized protein LOC131223917 isoform X2 [Magnolia sinica]